MGGAEALLPVSNNRCSRWRDHGQVISGIIHRISTGCQWRELPRRFGPWKTVHKRHLLWSADGTWEKLLQHVQAVASDAKCLPTPRSGQPPAAARSSASFARRTTTRTLSAAYGAGWQGEEVLPPRCRRCSIPVRLTK
ncbi:transposase [Streptantibioticus ferralitis]|uniref:transposase n=1 Tax=Streptantibioticus ferralitis TaxID=236510 RepID=UPI0035585DB5